LFIEVDGAKYVAEFMKESIPHCGDELDIPEKDIAIEIGCHSIEVVIQITLACKTQDDVTLRMGHRPLEIV